MCDHTNDCVGHTTDCRSTWNKCQLNHGLECISWLNTHLSHCRQWHNMHTCTMTDRITQPFTSSLSSLSRLPLWSSSICEWSWAIASKPIQSLSHTASFTGQPTAQHNHSLITLTVTEPSSLGSKEFCCQNAIFGSSKSANFDKNFATNPEFCQFFAIQKWGPFSSV